MTKADPVKIPRKSRIFGGGGGGGGPGVFRGFFCLNFIVSMIQKKENYYLDPLLAFLKGSHKKILIKNII